MSDPSRIETFAGQLYHWAFNVPSRGSPVRLARTALCRLFINSWLKVRPDLVMRISFAGRMMRLPAASPFPRWKARIPDFGGNLARLARHVRESTSELRMIDVGANGGDTIAMVREAVSDGRFFAVEADSHYFEMLTSNWGADPDIVAVCAIASDETAVREIAIERFTGTARVAASAAAEKRPVSTLDDLLASRPEFGAPNLLKIDTDSADTRVLAGACGLLAAHRPALFLEILVEAEPDRDAWRARLRHLASLGYEPVAVFEPDGRPRGRFTIGTPDGIERILNEASIDDIGYLDVALPSPSDPGAPDFTTRLVERSA